MSQSLVYMVCDPQGRPINGTQASEVYLAKEKFSQLSKTPWQMAERQGFDIVEIV